MCVETLYHPGPAYPSVAEEPFGGRVCLRKDE